MSNVWLASYPRSGNTMLRMILSQVFEIKSTSIYNNDLCFFAHNMQLVKYAGHYEMSEDEQSDCDRFTKTHDMPTDNASTIYIVRDARACLVSYYHYLNEIAGACTSMEDVIRGKCWPGNWSSHVRAWNAFAREDTIIIKYESMKSNIDSVIEVLSSFLNRAPSGKLDLSFEDLHRIEPLFFRKGSNESALDEINSHIEAFWSEHSQVMKLLDYV